ncbi:ORF1 [Mal de Rio Cuarto virus]|uniref:ORF1 n=1 Tax=Mal de Rio Cuarto virus TaxID=185954 RepID=A1X1F1_9REOV|nr:ORF1 [Mal de Rio Cuarto virus]AAY88706.1 ORF1 [Mal de Rio Cuarto virus]
MADLERRTFGSYKIEEITIKNDQQQKTTNQQQISNNEQRISTKKIPILDDGIFDLINYLLNGTHFDKTHYCGFDYSHLPTLERDFNTASNYVSENYSIIVEEIDLNKYERSESISLKSPDFTVVLEYFKKHVEGQTEQEENKIESTLSELPAKIIRELPLLPIMCRESEDSISEDILEGEGAVIQVLKMFMKGFLVHLGENPNSYDRQLTIEKYRPLLISIIGYEFAVGTRATHTKINHIYYQLATFDNYPFDLLRFQLQSLIDTPNVIKERIEKDGLFKVITTTNARGQYQSVLLRGINGSESYLNLKRYRKFKVRVVGNVDNVIKNDFSSLKLDV